MARRSRSARTTTVSISARTLLVAAAAVAGVVLAGFLFLGRGGSGAAMSHVHGLVVNPADGLVYIGTHEGLYRVEAGGKQIKRVGSTTHDLMSITVVGPNRFFASGHPKEVTRDLPADLGLIESVDGGKTWRAVALSGEADLHAMRLVDGKLYAYGNGTLAMSGDLGKRWELIANGELGDFVITKSGNVLATTRGGLMRSPSTPGAKFVQQAGPPVLWLSTAPDATIWGVTASGEVFHSADEGAKWERRGLLEGQPGALLATTDGLYIALTSGSLYRSTDGGVNWTRLGA